MIELNKMIPAIVLQNLTLAEKEYFTEIFYRFGGYPNLDEVWSLMDELWISLGCDPLNIDERVNLYYKHPVWLLNGLYIEQHPESLSYRKKFTKWVLGQNPKRVADFGGGFGGLARFIGEALPHVQIEVVDPHPHPAAIALAAATPNVRYVSKLSGEYDILIATDVFEHVPDPIGLVAETAANLRIGGKYLIANCFEPVIRCHLPQLFHFSISWDSAMQGMGLKLSDEVSYGRAFCRQGPIDITTALEKAECGRKLYPFVSWLPRGKIRFGKILMRFFCH
jgi:hypothetical protein